MEWIVLTPINIFVRITTEGFATLATVDIKITEKVAWVRNSEQHSSLYWTLQI
jgi:hypothetical protein